jgi:hypothetical protein
MLQCEEEALGNHIRDSASVRYRVGGQRKSAMNVNLTNPIFHDEAKALAHIEASRWPNGAFCPHCASTHVRRMGGKTTGRNVPVQ